MSEHRLLAPPLDWEKSLCFGCSAPAPDPDVIISYGHHGCKSAYHGRPGTRQRWNQGQGNWAGGNKELSGKGNSVPGKPI